MKDMSEEKDKEYLKSNLRVDGFHASNITSAREYIKSLESRLKEAEKSYESGYLAGRAISFESLYNVEKANSAGWEKKCMEFIDRIKDLEQRLSQAEAELKDSVRFNNNELAIRGKEIEELHQRLSQAEAENKAHKAALDFAKGAVADAIYCEDGLDGATGEGVLRIITEAQEKGTFDKEVANMLTGNEQKLMDEVTRLQERLSHLMDVAGKMAGALKEYAETCDCPEDDYEHQPDCKARIAKLALAEWDGIKEGGK